MQKEETKSSVKSSNNSFGITSVILGILSILLFFLIGVALILGILSLIFALNQRKKSKNKWSTWGIALSIIGIVIGIIVIWGLVSWISFTTDLIQKCTTDPSLPGCEGFSQFAQYQDLQGQLENVQDYNQ